MVPTTFEMIEKMGGLFSICTALVSLIVYFLGRPCREFQLARSYMKLRLIIGTKTAEEMERDKLIDRSLNFQFYLRWFCLKTFLPSRCCLQRCIDSDRQNRKEKAYLEEPEEEKVSFEHQWYFYNDMLEQVGYHLSLKHLASMDKYIKEH